MNDLTLFRKAEVKKIYKIVSEGFGGSGEIENETELDYALASVEARLEDEGVELSDCAAMYAYHLSKISSFEDKSKLMAAVVTELFVEVNGSKLMLEDDELLALFNSIASGEISRPELENRFRDVIG
jgi:death-on-curing protein